MSSAIPKRQAETEPLTAAGKIPLFTVGDLGFWIYLYPLQWTARFVPPRLLYWMGKLCEPVMQFQARHGKPKAERWMAQSGCVPEADAPTLARRFVSRQFARYLDELILLRPDSATALHCAAIEGRHHLDRALAERRGVILLSGHFRANRIATAYLARRGEAILSVHNQLPPNRNGGRLGRSLMPRFTELRRRANPEVLYIQDPQCSLKILKTLREGGIVRIQIDGVPGNKSVKCRFLGVPWHMPAGMFDLIRLSGCAVVPMIAVGCSRSFRIQFGESLPIAHRGSREDFIAANLPVLLGAVEKQVFDYPEEWILWMHQQNSRATH